MPVVSLCGSDGASSHPSVPKAPSRAIAAAGERACERFVGFFTSNIPATATPAAYEQAVSELLSGCEDRRVPAITAVQPVHVAGLRRRADPRAGDATAKQRLAVPPDVCVTPAKIDGVKVAPPRS